jgi:hypothetical protein
MLVGAIMMAGFALVALYLFVINPDKKATAADLVGTWVHQGSGVTVELSFDSNNHFHRLPPGPISGNAWGSDIPRAGSFTISDNADLGFESGGSFKAFINGNTLTLYTTGQPVRSFKFKRK